MAELLKTIKDETGHFHVVYLRDDGTGDTSTAKGHAHPVMGGQLQPFGEKEAHSHEYGPYEVKETKKDETDEDIVDAVLQCYKEASDIEEKSRTSAYEAEDMFMGDQWDEATKAELKEQKRAAITANIIESKLDNISGYQRQNRTEIKFIPVEGGDQRVADILNYVVKDITEYCYYQREKTKTFDDQLIAGRGLFNIYADYEKNIRGDVIIERFPWDEVKFGPHEKEDLSDLDYLIKEKWYTIARLREMYPDKASQLTPEMKYTETGSTARSEDWDKRHSEFKETSGGLNLINILKKQYKMLECWRKEYRRVFIAVNPEDEFVFNADGWEKADTTAIKTIPGFKTIPRVTYRMRVTKIASEVVLEDEYPEMSVNDYGIVPAYAKKRRNHFWGKVKGVIDLQSVINKAFSQFVDILNRMATYGWFYDDETFHDPKEAKKFKKNSATPGFTQRVRDVNKPPRKEEGIKWPNELVDAIGLFNTTLKEILNINLEMIGQDTNASGVALRQKIIQQLLGNDFVFDNMSFAEKKIGRMLISYIRDLYTPERIWRILVNQSFKDRQNPVKVGGRGIAFEPQQIQQAIEGQEPQLPYSKQDIIELLKTTDLERHDVVVAESPASPSAMMSNLLALLEIAGKGVQIPPDVFLEFAPIPQKEKIMQRIQQAMQAQADAENKKYDTELKKAVIAQQGKMMAKGGGGAMMPQGQPGGAPIG